MRVCAEVHLAAKFPVSEPRVPGAQSWRALFRRFVFEHGVLVAVDSRASMGSSIPPPRAPLQRSAVEGRRSELETLPWQMLAHVLNED